MKAVAVVGYGLRYPEAPDPDSFWNVIRNGRDTSRQVPDDRWTLNRTEALGGAQPESDRVRSDRGCFIDPPEGPLGFFDPELASAIDPSARLAVIAGVEAARKHLDVLDRDRTSVILGQLLLPTDSYSAMAEAIIGDTLEELVLDSQGREDRRPRGTARCHPLDRFDAALPAAALQRALQLRGGAYTLDAACASSLYAIAQACRDLDSGRCDAALAGGVSRPDCLFTQMGFSQLKALSPEGRCRPFDSRGQGLIVGEGAGVLLLKRLEDADRDGDTVLGVIRGIGLSNDMAGGLLAPSGEGQLRAMRSAYADAGWTPDQVDYIECHATGTPVGDATELRSLMQLWEGPSWRPGQCAIGSVKANIGHTLTAAGAAGIIKVLLAMDREEIPCHPDHQSPPEGIELDSSPFRIPRQPQAWLRRSGAPRRAAVSAFGFGGINAHLLVEEAVKPTTPTISVSTPVTTPSPIAIVGIGAIAGRHHHLHQVAPALLGQPIDSPPQPLPGDLGIPGARWVKERQLDFTGGESCGRLRASPVELRIPPTELNEMLPQQLALLDVAREAIAGARLADLGERGGLFVGLGLDPRSSFFHLRWMMPDRARHWLRELGIDADPDEVDEWIELLRDETGPPLDANRVMGALGSIAASRIARDLNAGGPAHTVSSEDSSGYRAVEMAVRALQDGVVDVALAASADLGLDILSRTLDANEFLPPHTESAVAFVLKRLADVTDVDGPIIATIDGLGSASGGNLAAEEFSSSIRETARLKALRDASITGDCIDLFCNDEINSRTGELAGRPGWKVTLPATLASSGCSSFLLSMLQGICAAHWSVLPADDQQPPVPWVPDRSDRRRILVENSGRLGDCGAMVISAEELVPRLETDEKPQLRCCGEPTHGVISLEGADPRSIESLADELSEMLPSSAASSASLARQWLENHPRLPHAARAVTIVFKSQDQLPAAIDSIPALLRGNAIELKGPGWEIHRSSDPPLGYSGDVTFLYPGSGSLYPGAGARLLARYPGATDHGARTSGDLSRWLGTPDCWRPDAPLPRDPRDAILAQVNLGCIGSDLLFGCGIVPQRAVGHSLGETTMLFALRAWRDRIPMQLRLEDDDLFSHWLAGEHRAAARAWNLPVGSRAPWGAAVIDAPAEEIKAAIEEHPRIYLLVVNAVTESVIGGDPQQVEMLCQERGWTPIWLHGVTSVHCPLVSQVASRYRELHHWPVHLPYRGVILHSTATGEELPVDSDAIADSLLKQATEGFHFPHLLQKLWKSGSRIFIETGPGASCSRLARKALAGLPQRTLPLFWRGEDEELSLARILAVCIAERVAVDLPAFLGTSSHSATSIDSLEIEDGRHSMIVPPLPATRPITAIPPLHPRSVPSRETAAVSTETAPQRDQSMVSPTIEPIPEAAVASPTTRMSLQGRLHRARQLRSELSARWKGDVQQPTESVGHIEIEPLQHETEVIDPPLIDRDQCLEFARGRVGPVLGPDHAAADHFPSRVRLPDEPLMLVDRILELEGEPLSLGPGRIVTAHDILPDAWYLDAGRIPTCIAVEAGQADLFLSAYLGADLHTRGLSVYRLLDAQVIFHDELPGAGNTIIYDIHIDEFFRQDKTLLFRFHFEGSVDGVPLISMRDGCAGFFSEEELASGRGIVHAPHRPRAKAISPAGWNPPAGTDRRRLADHAVDALRKGDLAGAYGSRFSRLDLRSPARLPGGKMRLLDEVTSLEPCGGDWGLGRVVAELAIHPDDWFLTCHFSDDPVMPGTLMYECCLHTLRTLLGAWGWVGEDDEVIPMPVTGIPGRLRCRGQVLPETARVSYDVQVKEIGFEPEPYVITDATMLADGRPIVEMEGMSLRLVGLTRQRIEQIWTSGAEITEVASSEEQRSIPESAAGGGGDAPAIGSQLATLYDHQQILEFATGRPSRAFGDRYLPFDEDRFIARLPGPPYCFLDRIVDVKGTPWVIEPGAACTAEYHAPQDAWYFDAGGQGEMPFAVLLEIALQPCGWLAAYIGSALTDDGPLQFRNLGGDGQQLKAIDRSTGLLTTEVKLTKADFAAGMWIQHFDLEVRDSTGPIYSGTTYFGFFPPEALAQQVGLPGAVARTIPPREALAGKAFQVPVRDDGPRPSFRMVEDVEFYAPQGGTAGLGFIRGGIDVNRDAWFFRAHFHGDPVWPGSLGLESMLQLLQVVARERWGEGSWLPRTLAVGVPHRWTYRGQVIPDRKRVVVEANIKEEDPERGILLADGMLLVDDLPIYSMEDFSVQKRELR